MRFLFLISYYFFYYIKNFLLILILFNLKKFSNNFLRNYFYLAYILPSLEIHSIHLSEVFWISIGNM